MTSSLVVSLVLLASAGGLLAWHMVSWRAMPSQGLEAGELDFRQRQLRRRVQTTAMLALLGVLIPLGQWLTAWAQSRLFAAIFWGGVLLLTVWMGLLALADMMATHYHYSRLRNDVLIERAKLQAELRRIESVRGNGKAAKRGREVDR